MTYKKALEMITHLTVVESESYDLLEKLANEKDEQESRKDKLVVGSEWVCVVDCHGILSDFSIGDVVKIFYIGDSHIDFNNDGMFYGQFLLCFETKEETE